MKNPIPTPTLPLKGRENTPRPLLEGEELGSLEVEDA
jgi:hypothetical protein